MTTKYQPKQQVEKALGHPLICQGVFVGLDRVDYGEMKQDSFYLLMLEECAGLPRDAQGRSQIMINEDVVRFVDENFVIGDLLKLPVSASARIDKRGNASLSVSHMEKIAKPIKLSAPASAVASK